MRILKNDLVIGVVFAAVTLCTIIASIQGWHSLVYVSKPLLMITLSLWFYFKSRRVGDRFTILIQAGLFFSLIGDVALMFEHLDEFYFMIGLGAFLIAQLCYTIAFALNIANAAAPFSFLPWLIGTGIAAYGVFFAMDLMPRIDEVIKIPVGAYAVAITLMGLAASFRFGRTFPRSFVLVLIGAFLFIASDSLLATNRFLRTLDHASWSIILTYAIGQYLIVAGCLAHVLDPEEIRRRASLTT